MTGQAPARSQPSWPRRPQRRGNSAPSTDTGSGTVPPGQIKKILTEPLFRDAEAIRYRVIIKAYALPWDKLKLYLETQLGCDLSQLSPSTVRACDLPLCVGRAMLTSQQMTKDIYTIYLPRELTVNELLAIDALRIKDPRQQKRIEERPEKTPSRPLDSDEE